MGRRAFQVGKELRRRRVDGVQRAKVKRRELAEEVVVARIHTRSVTYSTLSTTEGVK